MYRFAMMLALFSSACSDRAEEPMPPLSAGDRVLLERALERAVVDSLMLANSSFQADGAMAVEFGQDEEQVRIEDDFLLDKGKGGEYQTRITRHATTGDTTLLKDMYTFRDSKGNPRAAERSQLAGLHFGTDFLGLLRVILSGAAECSLADSMAVTGGRPCRLFAYRTEEKEGKFWIDRDAISLVRMEVEYGSSAVVGSYRYRMTIEYGRPFEHVLLPMNTVSRFEYDRLFSEGTGSITVHLSNVGARREQR